ncbi:RrF2 family transcriptional regulator [candidate division WOR-3 bacterium]|nr:RrF2 family transcriptional regulator [candidate division WOR-3 bacterium]
MKLTTKTRYALRALIEMAQQPPGKALSGSVIAKRQRVKPKYLEQILYRLRQARLIRGKKGPGGGFSLARDPREIRLRDVLEAVGETTAPVLCLLGKADSHCARAAACPMKACWNELKQRVDSFFDNYTLADIFSGASAAALRKEKSWRKKESRIMNQ